MIYLDNAATTLVKPESVRKAVYNAINHMGNSSRGAYDGALDAARTIYNTRQKLADLFNFPRADHVVFTQNSTEALNIAIAGILEQGDHVITTDLEHNSVLRPLYHLEKEKGIEISFIEADTNGEINYNDFEKLIKPNTKAIISTHASNLTGKIVNIEKVGAITKKHNLIFVVDASQTAGAHNIDGEKSNIDILCFTGHKGLMGPTGTGGLCIKPGIEIKSFKFGGTGIKTYNKEQPTEYPVRLEAGTLNIHGIAGLSAAIDFLNETTIDKIREKEIYLAQKFYNGIKDVDGLTFYGPTNFNDKVAIVTLNIKDYDSGKVSDALSSEFDIATRAGAHCAPRLHQALNTVEQGAVRFSFAYFNDESDIETAIKAIKTIASY
ncbi:MAG: aminotransferase class V-fold PLP-dependent enzyme [Eubacteriales bacterium]|nr:aminotransferase class V-fold PLP-dependent enzyme [Eubacteriales bacterium]MDY3332290.1 aminotransferase class V-fold PLP-dependent enzyme [Gallibacter sp.]